MNRAKRAFTLIELLVVIAIIALLISILLPGLKKSREAGRAVVCLSNQRQIGAALMSYANAYKEWIPRESGFSEVPPGPNEWRPVSPQNRIPNVPAWFHGWVPASRHANYNISWAFNLRPFLDGRAHSNDNSGGMGDRFKDSHFYRDPARPKDDHTIHYVVNGVRFIPAAPGVLVANENVAKPPHQLFRILRTSSILYLTCYADDLGNVRSGYANINASSDLELSVFYDIFRISNINGPESGDPRYWPRTAPRRHGNGANAVYMDGHAGAITKSELQNVKTWDDGDHR
jgi:prepilin-type N-terminal cleavage/methylation domain-containing protein/prepilin-type processing-associated H-X9-DG protein